MIADGRPGTLGQYEAELAAAISSVTLLGQLRYDAADLEQLRRALGPLFAGSVPNGLDEAGRRYPLTFALYLVLEGLYHYIGGDYWSGPRETLGVTSSYTSRAGDKFRGALRGAGLPTFENLGGHINVAPILAHGGIPNYCLKDFFDLLNWAARHRPAVDVPTLMDEWAAEGFRVNLDKPAQRFLLHGGDMAEEFVERCLALLGEDADPESLDLPLRVLEQYDAWRTEHPTREKGRSDYRLTRPRLICDPYGESIAIILPPVFFATGQAPAGLVWQIDAGERRCEEATWRRQLGQETEFSPRNPVVNILTVAPTYTVAVAAGDAPLQSWTLPGPADPPLLAFDADSGELLGDSRRDNKAEYWITPGERHLVFPRGWSARPDERARKRIEQLDGEEGDWSAFAVETWTLEPDGRVELLGPDGQCATFCARNDPPPARPWLDGEPLIAPGVDERYALYAGRPPLLRIPPGRGAHDPTKWHIRITPIDAADPPTLRASSLADLPQHCVMLDGDVLLSLDAPELLGPVPIGEFHIHLRGPYTRKAEFHVRFAPGLSFDQDPPLYLALDDAPTRFRIGHAAGFELRALTSDTIFAPATPVSAGPAAATSGTLVVAPERTRVPLRLEAKPLSGTLAPAPAVEFELPVHRLRFGLAEPERPDDFRWATTPLRLHPAALDAPHSVLLRADLPPLPGAPPLPVGWRLAALDGRVLRKTPPRPASRHPQTGLAEWLDTFHHDHEGDAALLQLVVIDGAETVIDVVRLLPTLELGRVMTEWAVDETGSKLSLVWKAAAPIRNRQARLWPVDRPWVTAPVILPVPDEASDFAEWSLPPQALLPGEYLAEMIVHDPWDISAPVRPAPGAPNTFVLQPDDMGGALDAALTRARHDELPADEALAWVLCMARTGLDGSLARLNITLKRERGSLGMAQFVLWADAVRALDPDQSYRLVLSIFFEEERIARLGELAADDRRAWLAHLPAGLEPSVYRALLPLADGEARRVCIRQLCAIGDEAGFLALLEEVNGATMSIESTIEIMMPVSQAAADFLFTQSGTVATSLLGTLLKRKHNKRIIGKGTDLKTNVGYIQVTSIRDTVTNSYVDFCYIDSECHQILGKLWPTTSRLPVSIDQRSRIIQLLTSPVHKCQIGGCDYVYRTVAELNQHYKSDKHRIPPYLPGKSTNLELPLTTINILPPDGPYK